MGRKKIFLGFCEGFGAGEPARCAFVITKAQRGGDETNPLRGIPTKKPDHRGRALACLRV
jgi:hypothetical protein